MQAQVFTVVNHEDYCNPDLIKGMIVDGDKGDDAQPRRHVQAGAVGDP